MTAKAYSYLRFSTPDQMKGDSFRRQTAMSDAFAAKHGLKIEKHFRDLGMSAYRGKNKVEGELADFLAMVEDGRIPRGSWLLVESLDRLSRDRVGEALPDFLKLLKAGIVVATLCDERVYDSRSVDDPLQLVGSLIVMSRAHEESARKSQRNAEAWKARRAKAAKNAVCPAWLTLKGDSYEVIPDRAQAVRLMFEMTADGFGVESIVRRLNALGIPPFSTRVEGKSVTAPTGRGWHTGTIHGILRSRAPLGEYQGHRMEGRKRVPDGDPIPNHFPAIIDQTLWMRAHSARRKIGFGKGKRSKYVNLFEGRLFCTCGSAMTTDQSGKPRRRYLRCADARHGTGCPGGRHFLQEDVETAILDHVEEYRLSELFSNPEADSQLREIDNQMIELREMIAILQKEQDSLVGHMAKASNDPRIVDPLMKGVRERSNKMQSCQDALKAFEGLRSDLILQCDQRADIEAVVNDLRKALREADEADVPLIRAKLGTAIRTFIDMIRFDPQDGTIDVILLGGLTAYKFQQSARKGNGQRINKRVISYVGKACIIGTFTPDLIRRSVATVDPTGPVFDGPGGYLKAVRGEGGYVEDQDRVDAFTKATQAK